MEQRSLAPYVFSISWYRMPGAVPRGILGLPDCVAVAVLKAIAVAASSLLALLDRPPGRAHFRERVNPGIIVAFSEVT